MRRLPTILGLALVLVTLAGCSDGDGDGSGERSGRGRPGGMPGSFDGAGDAAVPVEVASVERRGIASFIETNGTLEAEYEVDIVARVAAPIVELLAEEGMVVEKGQLVARLDDIELRAQLEVSRVTLNETKLSYERATELQRGELISTEEFERAKAVFESARATFEANSITLDYTQVRAPFGGWIILRYVDVAENLTANAPLFRISDFTPLLCPIRVPERGLSRLRVGQRAHLTVETWPDERFDADVLRISPVVDASTGTVKVTLQVDSRDKLRPGMFARVFVETERHDDTLVIPKTALSLESIGDTVYVAAGDVASRREVTLGFREGDYVEILSGVAEHDLVVIVGQDGLSEGTPLQVLRRDGESQTPSPAADALAREGGGPPGAAGPAPGASGARGGPGGPGGHGQRAGFGGPGGRPDFASMTPEQLERAKELMRGRGMTEEQIEERITRARERSADEGRPPREGGDSAKDTTFGADPGQ